MANLIRGVPIAPLSAFPDALDLKSLGICAYQYSHGAKAIA
jgi:hypothetical protein